MIAMTSMNNHYGWSFFCTSAIFDGKPQSTYSDRILKCSSSSVANFVFSTVIQSSMSVHNSIAVGVMYMPGISSSLLVLWLYLNSQFAMYNFGLGFNGVLLLYWWIYNCIFMIILLNLSQTFLLAVCDLLLCCLHR